MRNCYCAMQVEVHTTFSFFVLLCSFKGLVHICWITIFIFRKRQIFVLTKVYYTVQWAKGQMWTLQKCTITLEDSSSWIMLRACLLIIILIFLLSLSAKQKEHFKNSSLRLWMSSSCPKILVSFAFLRLKS